MFGALGCKKEKPVEILDLAQPSGRILLQGHHQGNTILKVTDQVTGEVVSLDIYVVPPFLPLKISDAVAAIRFLPFEPGVSPFVPEDTRNEIREKTKTYADFASEDILILQKGSTPRFFVLHSVNFETGEKISCRESYLPAFHGLRTN